MPSNSRKGFVTSLAIAALAVGVGGGSASADAEELPDTPYGKGAVVKFNKDGSTSMRLLTWHQVWGRHMQLNPGSTVNGLPKTSTTDIALRRSRFLAFAKIRDKARIMMHFGINNQSFNGAKKPQLYVHGAWVEYPTGSPMLDIGAGLHYWNGISRMTNASTLNFLALDSPITHWATIERADQFARQMGIYAKGKIGILDYRVAVNKPFMSGFTSAADIGPAADYNPEGKPIVFAGYGKLELGDAESNVLPYAVGTYLGKKSVLNVGAGFYFQPKAMHSRDGGEREEHDLVIASGDVFLDRPVGTDGGAVTAYASFVHADYGPGHIRNIGILNVAQGGDDANRAGNAYPSIGTGEHFYAQAGWLLPKSALGGRSLQPYVASQVSLLDARDDAMFVLDGGANYYLEGHQAKLTLHYRNRPLFGVGGDAIDRLSEVILQAQVAL